jgi:formylglycine-generating enzyme required for sulfatase activity
VFTITQLSHHLLDNPTWEGAWQTLLLLAAVWFAWIYTTWTTNYLDPERLTALGFVAAKREGMAYLVPPLCVVPAGEFLMGSDRRQDSQAFDGELPQHRVTLPTFQIARFLVTVAEYACFVRAGHRQPGDWQRQLGKLDHPVVSVSWHDATAYTAWLGLPCGRASPGAYLARRSGKKRRVAATGASTPGAMPVTRPGVTPPRAASTRPHR